MSTFEYISDFWIFVIFIERKFGRIPKIEARIIQPNTNNNAYTTCSDGKGCRRRSPRDSPARERLRWGGEERLKKWWQDNLERSLVYGVKMTRNERTDERMGKRSSGKERKTRDTKTRVFVRVCIAAKNPRRYAYIYVLR